MPTSDTSPAAVAVVEPHRGPAVQAVYATGTVEPSVMVPISPRGTARLVELKVDEGSVVEKGQLLARLENDDLRRAIMPPRPRSATPRRSSTARHSLSSAASRRAALMIGPGPIGRRRRRSASAPQAEPHYLDLVAPAAGTIIRRDGEIGQMIGRRQAASLDVVLRPAARLGRGR